MDETEAEETLRQRLLDTGAEFKGAFPSSAEIARARRKSARDKDLEGIDVSNVLEGSRRRRQPDSVDPSSKRQRQSGGDSSTGHGKGTTAGTDSPASEGDSASADDDDSESECEF